MGCFAWSARSNAVACYVGARLDELLLRGVVILRDSSGTLVEVDQGNKASEVNERLARDDFRALPPAVILAPNRPVALPDATITWRDDGSVTVRCRGIESPLVGLDGHFPVAELTTAVVAVTRLDGHAIVEYRTESGHYEAYQAGVVDLETCSFSTAFPPLPSLLVPPRSTWFVFGGIQ